MTKNWFAALSLLGALTGTAQADTWKVDGAHSMAQFTVRHMMVSNVRGQLAGLSGTVNIDAKDVTKSVVDVAIDVSTLNTQNVDRDKHLKSADFFDVAKFPKMTFKSTKVESAGDHLKVSGDLTLHGVTKSVVLMVELSPAVKDAFGKQRRGVSATAKFNRKDFGLGWNKALEAGGLAVGEEVSVQLDVELTP